VAGVNLARILFINGICSKSVSPNDELWLMDVSKSSSTKHIGEWGKPGGCREPTWPPSPTMSCIKGFSFFLDFSEGFLGLDDLEG
jgi:hypothetical protein